MAIQRYIDPANPGRLAFDKSFYRQLAGEDVAKVVVDEFIIPPRSSRAWPVPQAHLCRIETIEGPQVGDLNVWNLTNPRERFWNARTRQLNGAHVTTLSRLWSTLPYLRPMLTFINDTVPPTPTGARAHDLLGSRCDPYMYKLVEGRDFDLTCHALLTRAIAPYHLNELDVHDVLNLFQVTYLSPDDEIPVGEASPARAGDFVEFFAEIDLLCAVATCHSGDFSIPGIASGTAANTTADPASTCRPLRVQVSSVDQELLAGWSPPESPTIPPI